MKQCKLVNYLEPRRTYNKGKRYSIVIWRKKILDRDNNTCQNCFNSIKDAYRKRTFSNEAHHIVARKDGGYNTINNGITLCKFCHQYFDLMYQGYGMDYFDVILTTKPKQRIKAVKRLLRKRYKRYLLNMMYGPFR